MVIIIQRRGSSVSVYEAGRSTDSSIYTGMGDNDGWEDDDMSWPDTGAPKLVMKAGMITKVNLTILHLMSQWRSVPKRMAISGKMT